MAETRYSKIYHTVKTDIQRGYLLPNAKLPSKRKLAEDLGVSVNTVSAAYDQLAAEGYIEIRPQSGCFVCDIGELVQLSGGSLPTGQRPSAPLFSVDFSPAAIDQTHFPFNLWRRLLRQCFDELDLDILKSPPAFGLPALRQTIALYLHQSRGIDCNSEHILVGTSTASLLRTIADTFDKNMVLATENPVYNQALEIFRKGGHQTASVDIEGDLVTTLNHCHADVFYVTPSHQFPLGFSMPVSRRVALLNWAAQGEHYIIEDDYDSEFRYTGKPLPPIRSMDTTDRVIYMGTFSRSVSPALKISYALLPACLFPQISMSASVSRLEQKTLALFMQEGHFESHINKMRKLYGKKRILLSHLLRQYAGVSIMGENAGLNLLVAVEGQTQDRLMELAAVQGIRVYPISQYFANGVPTRYRGCVLLGYGSLELEQIETAAHKLCAAWGLCLRA